LDRPAFDTADWENEAARYQNKIHEQQNIGQTDF
jgi:hypothetical protein